MPESIGCAACAIWIHVRPSMIFLKVIDRSSPPPAFNGKHVNDHIMTVAIQDVAVGDEIFCDYAWG